MRERATDFILRAALSFTLIYAAIAGFLEPSNWSGFFPSFAVSILPATTLLLVWGIVEIILGIWILFGRKIFIPSLITALSLTALIVTNWGAMDILFRDVAVLAIAIVLAMRARIG